MAKPRPVPRSATGGNRTVPGSGKGTVTVKSGLTEPLIPPDDWEMLRDKPPEHPRPAADSN